MSGIVNSTGAVSGVIGTTVGTPSIKEVLNVLSSTTTFSTGTPFNFPEVVTDTSILTYSSGTWTVVQAGYYLCIATLNAGASANSQRVFLYKGSSEIGESIYFRSTDTDYLSKTLSRGDRCVVGDTLSFRCSGTSFDAYEDFNTIQILRLGD